MSSRAVSIGQLASGGPRLRASPLAWRPKLRHHLDSLAAAICKIEPESLGPGLRAPLARQFKQQRRWKPTTTTTTTTTTMATQTTLGRPVGWLDADSRPMEAIFFNNIGAATVFDAPASGHVCRPAPSSGAGSCCCTRVKIVQLAAGCTAAAVGCDRLIVNQIATSANFKQVQRQILGLQRLNATGWRQVDDESQLRDELRLATIFSIYLKLLRLGPLEIHWRRSKMGTTAAAAIRRRPKTRTFNNNNNDHGEPTSLEQCRVNIVDYIEHLSGYSQDMNQLRHILKSHTMIKLIGAYETLANKLDSYYTDDGSGGSDARKLVHYDLTPLITIDR